MKLWKKISICCTPTAEGKEKDYKLKEGLLISLTLECFCLFGENTEDIQTAMKLYVFAQVLQARFSHIHKYLCLRFMLHRV